MYVQKYNFSGERKKRHFCNKMHLTKNFIKDEADKII